MKIGFSKMEITPPLPMKLAGFAKERIAQEVRDPLYVSAVVFASDEGDVVLYSLDLVAVDHLLVDGLRLALKEYNIKEEHVQLFATHTHSGPGGIGDMEKTALIGKQSFMGDTNPAYIQFIIRQCVRAYEAAKETEEEALIRLAKGNVSGIGKNRVDSSRKGDESLFVLEVEQKNGKKALFYNLVCHPTVLNMNSDVVSADIPGAVRDQLDEYDTVLFANGPCGDISTRFTRASNDDSELNRYASIAKEAIKTALRSPFYEGELNQIQIQQEHVELAVKEPLSVQAALEKVEQQKQKYEEQKTKSLTSQELRLAQSFVEGAMADLEYAKHHEDVKSYTLEINRIRLQEETIITVPGELFSELSNPLKERYGCTILGYANGYFMYIADTKGYDEHTYEASSSPFVRGQGEELMKQIQEKLLEK